MAEDRQRRNAKDNSRPRLTAQQVEMMLACLARNSHAFRTARDKLELSLFVGRWFPYGLLWEAVVRYHDAHGHLPDATLLRTDVQQLFQYYSASVRDADVHTVMNFISWAYDPNTFSGDPEEDRYAAWSLQRLEEFLQERYLDQTVAAASNAERVPADVPGLLENLEDRINEASHLGQTEPTEFLPSAWEEQAAVPTWSTGLSYLDEMFGGGHADGEVYGVLGPFGSCKTTLGCQMLAYAAEQFYHDWQNGKDEVPKVAVIISYESPISDLRNRVVGCAASIHRNSLEGMTTCSDLSCRGHLHSYEHEEMAGEIQNAGGHQHVHGEQERLRNKEQILNQHVLAIDLSGADPRWDGVGKGFIRELASVISTEMRRRGTKCGFIAVDYVGAMVDRYLSLNDLPEDQTRHMIKRAPFRAKNYLAQQFGCPVYLFHQYAGEYNQRNPTAPMDHTMSSECKSFGENVDFHLSIGNQDAHGRVLMMCTKHRRSARSNKDYVFKIRGELYRVEQAVGYMVDHNSRQFVHESEANTVARPGQQQSSGGGNNGDESSGGSDGESDGESPSRSQSGTAPQGESNV